ncbi:putative acetyltransferase [Gracilibacillus halotolerans]|uniref:Putative acetyltransferase n=1 Tax=Gracilibacillus halotolerans TaxID=74386 RepID=A0A841RFL0_9BACI|nr:GNAT family N-acetyltransferase [Gracilibacillus halotolerans]MBB6512870.1 putative acetyltransferase [Gracilibacillus halotolerans]
MPDIRKIDTHINEEILRMSEYAFQYRLTEAEFKRKKKDIQNHSVFGSFEEGNLAAKVHIIPLEVFINRQTYKMGGVAGVATWPEYRRSGHVKGLLKQSLQDMKEKGQVLSFLHPFSIPFYRKYGWELIFEQKKLKIPINDLRKKWNIDGKVRRTPFNEDAISVIQPVYESFAKNYNGPLTRDINWWMNRIWNEDLVVAIGYNEKDEADSYIIYKVKNRIFQVEDYAYHSLFGLKRILEFMSNHDSMVDYIEIKVPANEKMDLLFQDRQLEQQVKAYFMGRIVNVEKFLQQFPYKASEGFKPFQLRVEDAFMPENSGTYVFEQDQHTITIKKQDNTDYPVIECSVQQLTAIMLSYQTAQELAAMGLITGDEQSIEQLNSLVPVQQTYMPDFF